MMYRSEILTQIPYCGEHAAMFDAWKAHGEERVVKQRERGIRVGQREAEGRPIKLPTRGTFMEGLLSPTEIVRYFVPSAVGLGLVGALVTVALGGEAVLGAAFGGLLCVPAGAWLSRAAVARRREEAEEFVREFEVPQPDLPVPREGEPKIEWHGFYGHGALGCSVDPVTKEKGRPAPGYSGSYLIKLTAIRFRFDNPEYGRRFAALNPRA